MPKDKDTKTYELPKPAFPDLGMPEEPKTNAPKEAPHFNCEGEAYKPIDAKHSPIPPPDKGIKRILIGVPILTYSHEFVQSFLRFWTQLQQVDKPKYEVGYYFAHRKPVHMADQTIVDIALYNKCTHVLFIDDDITDITKDMFDALLDADKDVIAGVMHASKFPFAACVFRRYNTNKKVIDMPADNSMYRLYEVPAKCEKCDTPVPIWGEFHCPKCGQKQDNSIQKADLIPFCFTLMKVEIFNKIKKPWFHCTTMYPADSWFSDRCIEAGIQQWGHMKVRLTHAGVNDTTKQHLFQAEMAKKQQTGDPGLIHLSADDMKKHEFLLNEKMKEAEVRLKHGDVQFVKATDSKPKTLNSVGIAQAQEEEDDSKKSNRSRSVQRKKSA